MALSNVINSAFQLLDEEAQWTPTGPQAQQVSTPDQTHHHANPGGQSRQHDDQSHTQEKPTLTQPSNAGVDNPDSQHHKTHQRSHPGGARPRDAAEHLTIGQQRQATLGWQQPPSQEYLAHAHPGGARPRDAAEQPTIGQQRQATLGWQQPASQVHLAHAHPGGARPRDAAEQPTIGQQRQAALGWQQPASQEYFAHVQHSHNESDVDIWSRSNNIAEVSMKKLKEQGFTKVEDLYLLSPPDLERLKLPLRDEVKLRAALQDVQRTKPTPSQPQTSEEPKDLRNILNELNIGINKQTAPVPSPVDDPLVYLTQPSGEKVAYYDIVDFVPGVVNVKERFILPGGDGRVVFESGPKRPKLESVSPCQWGAANARIMYKLISEGSLNGDAIQQYLAYTVKICQLGQRFMWNTVLMYDRQYRELQATLNFHWGVDCPHLHQVALREKPIPKFTPESRSRSFNTNHKQDKVIDHKSGKEVCMQYNTNNCPRGESCRYAHVCLVCFRSHSKRDHPN